MDTSAETNPAAEALPASDPPAIPKRAVVIVHGMGSQPPMSTLRGFVDAVWTSVRPSPAKDETARIWPKRDDISGSFELRRIATNEDTRGIRTDFFEFYWADMMEDTRLSSVVWWLQRLFFRGLDRVPKAVRAPWMVGWVALVALALAFCALGGLVVATLWAIPVSPRTGAELLAVATMLVLALWWFRHRVLIEVVGDAARYLTASPENIAARTRIRQAGLDLLERLHRGDTYDRIVVVGHSLGTVVGYDILSFYWSKVSASFHHPKGGGKAANALANAAAKLTDDSGDEPERETALRRAYRARQTGYFNDVKRLAGGAWKITDFVTLGSPLAHAHFLLVDDGERLLKSDKDSIANSGIERLHRRLNADAVAKGVARVLAARMGQREFPTCPPLPDLGTSFLYVPPRKNYSLPHHAAVFAPVRWTNIYAPRRWVFWGDVIAGPLSPVFGPGVRDVRLKGAAARKLIAHVHYWNSDLGDNEHIRLLRAALALFGRRRQASTKRRRKVAPPPVNPDC